MSTSTSITPSNMELTPQRVTWNSVDLGGTLGNVQVAVKVSKAVIKADQHGTSPLDMRITGLEVHVTTELAETRSVAQWAVLFPSFLTTGTASNLARLQIGRSDRDNAKALNLHPIVKDDSDLSTDINFYLAHPNEDTQFTYGPSEQVKAKIVWHCYPVLTGTSAPKWGGFGTGL